MLLSAGATLLAGLFLFQQIREESETAYAAPLSSPKVNSNFEAQPVRRCLNIAAALEAPPGENWGYTIRAEDFSRIRQAGFDTIRLPVKWSAYTGPGPDYKIDARFLRQVDSYVTEAMRRGLQVMLNVHHFDGFNERPDAEEARLFAIWQQLAAHFEDHDNALIFELLNEPHFDGVTGVGDEDYSKPTGIARMNRINSELVTLIRQTHPDRWLVLGSSQWGSHYPMTDGVDGVRFTPEFDPRVMTTFHFYEPMEFTHQDLDFTDYPPFPRPWGTSRDRAAINSVFQDVVRYRESEGQGMPVLLGEFGTASSLPPDQRVAWTQHVREQSEGHAMGWCAFDFASPNYGMFDTRRNEWNGPLLQTLILED